MSAVWQMSFAANDNEAWSQEAYSRLIELNGRVLTTILKRLSGRRSIAAQEVAEIIRHICREAADKHGRRCSGTRLIENAAVCLESDGPIRLAAIEDMRHSGSAVGRPTAGRQDE